MFEKTFEWTSVFIGLIQRTRSDFYRRPKKTTFLTNFLSNGHLAHTIRFFIVVTVLRDWSGCSIVGARVPIFLSQVNNRIKGPIFIGPNIDAHDPIVTPIFCLRKKIPGRMRWV